ncbi:hypothetical protein [Frondihabitans sp. Leaf304]|uniref:hypothetical protein n=1 Tax=Frondihabitans sp. Leaf304 TaxID=1736329 RepID=UPI0007021BF4|nr:hypothetical protein [Frondihabitans sp. Leaf304]KQQ25429.1 hypothetical protein ASF54_13420 [Frondihabitans sp. Leaf304]
MINVPRWLTLGLVTSFALFAIVFGLVVVVSKPEVVQPAIGLALFATAFTMCVFAPQNAAPSHRRAGFIAIVGLLLPVLGSAALNPSTDSFSNGAWYVSGVVCLVVELLLRHRQRLAWLVLAGLVVQTLVWAGPWGLLHFGIIATILMVAVVTVSAWAIGVTGAEISRHVESERQAATWRAAQEAFHAERQVRLGTTALVAAPMLRAISDKRGRLSAEDRAECRLLEQTIRDEIRGRQLLSREIREQVMLHRRRGAVVQVNDDGGLDDLDPVDLERLLGQVAAAITGLTSDRIIIRTAPADSPTAITVAAMSVDPVAVALGLDGEDDQVDLWLELPRAVAPESTLHDAVSITTP